MSRVTDKIFNLLATASLFFLHPIIGAVFRLVYSVIFIVLFCLAIMGKISFRFFIIFMTVPILGWLCLLGFLLGLLRLLSKFEKNTPPIRPLIESYISTNQSQTALGIASGENDNQLPEVSQVRPWVRYWAGSFSSW